MDTKQCKMCGRNLTELEYIKFQGLCIDCKSIDIPKGNSNKHKALNSFNIILALEIIALVEFIAGFVAGCVFRK